MRFLELTEAVRKKKPIRSAGKLKDGTPVEIFVEQEPEKVTVWLRAGDEFLGMAGFGKADYAGRHGKWVASSTFINTEWRRKGANTLMYDAVEKLGYQLIPEPRSNKLSADGAAFWRARRIRSGRVNESEGVTISPEQAHTILTDRRCKHGVKISPNTRLWRGVSEQSGHGMATYGLGLYFTANKKDAAAYGRVVEVSRSMLPDNPLRFDGVNDYQIWLQTAQRLLGYPSNREFVVDFDDIGRFVRALDPSIDGIQLFSGKDAMFVTYGVDHINEDVGQAVCIDDVPDSVKADIIDMMLARTNFEAAYHAEYGVYPTDEDVKGELFGLAKCPFSITPLKLSPKEISNAKRSVSDKVVQQYRGMTTTPPPILVRKEGRGWKIVEGGHRLAAAQLSGREMLDAYDVSAFFDVDWAVYLEGEPLTEKLIDNPATKVVLQARKDMGMSPWAINNGWCMGFALRLIRKLGDGAEMVSTTGVPGGFPGHSVVLYKGLYYDAESPEGVKTIPELAYCKRLRAIADGPEEELEEKAPVDTPLYHYTTFKGANGILGDGFIHASGSIRPYISLTRDQHLNFYNNLVRFDIDTRRLKARFKVVPHNYWPGGASARSESEERVMAEQIPLAVVRSITLLPPDARRTIGEIQYRTGDEIAAKAKALGIEVIDRRPPLVVQDA